MSVLLLRHLRRRRHPTTALPLRHLTTSAQHVAARHRDATFEKLMDGYKHLLKVVAVADLIQASPDLSLPLPLLSAEAQRLHLNRGALHFSRSFPRVFHLQSSPIPLLTLTPAASHIRTQESTATSAQASATVLTRLLSISPSNSLPLRAIFRVWRDLGLPDDFEHSVLARNPDMFIVRDNPKEPNTHFLHLNQKPTFSPAVQKWRVGELAENEFAFKMQFPPGMKLTKDYRKKVKAWQRVAYVGPYDVVAGRRGKAEKEKRAVGIVHEFLSLTVEKMVEVEKISHFRRWFGIEMNVRDLFLDHPGIFYLSTKGKRHTVFLREAYDRGRLVESNPIYEARMRLLDLVLLRRRGMVHWEGGENKSLEVKEEQAVSDNEDDDLCS